ncbi:MAG: hypothetical protein ACXIVE_05865 [Salinarimonas sp.]
MNMEIKVTGISLYTGKASGTTRPIAFADIEIPEWGLTLEGVMLGVSAGKVYARPPSARLTARPERSAIFWGYSSLLGDAIRDAIMPAFFALGGELPAKTTPPPGPTDGQGRVARTVRDGDEAEGVRRVIRSDYAAEMKRAGLD